MPPQDVTGDANLHGNEHLGRKRGSDATCGETRGVGGGEINVPVITADARNM